MSFANQGPQPQFAFNFENTVAPYVGALTYSPVGSGITYPAGKYLKCIDVPNSGGFQNRVDYTYTGSFIVDTGFSVAFWVKPYTTGGYFLQFYGSAQSDGFGGGPHVTFTVTTNGKVTATLYNYQVGVPGTSYNSRTSVNNLSLSEFTHVAATVGGGNLTLYVNGVAEPVRTYIQNGMNLNSFFRLGSADGWGPASAQYDDLRVFKQLLSASDVTRIYNQQGAPPKMLDFASTPTYDPTLNLYMPFNNTTTDSIRSSVPVSLNVSPNFNQSGKYSQSVILQNDVATPTTTGLRYSAITLNSQVGVSYAFWIKFIRLTPTVTRECIIDNFPFYAYFYTQLFGQTGFYFNFYYNSPSSVGGTAAFSPDTGVWYHVVYTIGGGLVKTYINGSIGRTSTSFTPDISWTNTIKLAYSNAGGESPSIELDDFRIYNKELSASQVSSLYSTFTPYSITMSGAPLFSKLPEVATSSAVGAFSLRAVNGGVAKAVQVVSHPMGVWPPVAMTSNVTTATGTFNGVTNGVYTASESVNTWWGQNNSYRIFDNDPTGTYWHSALTYNGTGAYIGTTTQADGYTGEWIQIQFPTPIILYSYSMIDRFNAPTRSPKNFRIYGSNDGTTWTNIDTRTNVTQWSFPTRLAFTLGSNTNVPYSYFRLVVNATIGENSIQVSSWILNGPAAVYTTGSPTDFWADRLGKLWTTPYTGQTLADWLGGGVGYVSALYDQSGSGNDATQNTPTAQPIIQRATKGPGYMCVFSGSQGLIFGAYNLLNDTPYSTIVVNRRIDPKLFNYYLCGSGSTGSTDRYLHTGYRSATALAFAQYADDFDITVPTYVSSTTEPLFYNTMIHDTNHTGRQYAYAGGTLYPVTPATRTFLGFLNQSVGSSFSIGSGFGTFIGEIYEVLVFTKSLYDLDNTGGLITQIYQDQLGYTGA
jgi:hypothetical protein